MNTTRTQVSRASAGIKAILSARTGSHAHTFSMWTGRKVTVIEAIPSWQRTVNYGNSAIACCYFLAERTMQAIQMPTFNTSAPVTLTAQEGCAIVIWSRSDKFGAGEIEIVIPAGEDYREAIDHDALAVATDALVAGQKRWAFELLSYPQAPQSGIALALAEARAKALIDDERDHAVIQSCGDDGVTFADVQRAAKRRRKRSQQRYSNIIKAGGTHAQAAAEVLTYVE